MGGTSTTKQPTNTNQNPQNTQVKRTIDNIVKKWMDVVVWVSWPYLGLYLGTITSSGLFSVSSKAAKHKFWVTSIIEPGSQRAMPSLKNSISQRKLQRSSIFKSTLDDIQHFEIMFQLENQMWGAEECSDLFGSVGETFLKSFELKPIESMAYKRQLWMSHCMKMFSINVLLSKLILDSRRSMAFWNLCQN